MPRSLCLAVALLLHACAVPPAEPGEPRSEEASEPPAAAIETDASVRTIQLYQSGNEASLPILGAGAGATLTLEFDVLGDAGVQPLSVRFAHVDARGEPDLLPTEFLRGFERDEITDARASGATAVRYAHYRYAFPNPAVGFRVSGRYRLVVSDADGRPLFERAFLVAEGGVDVDLDVGSVLAGGVSGPILQPSARLRIDGSRPGRDALSTDPSRYTVCFVRNGELGDARCAPEPSLSDFETLGFFLPRERAFGLAPTAYGLDLGALRVGDQVLDVDYGARPPTATLEIDYDAFGSELVEPFLFETPVVSAAYRDAGDGDLDAEYVDVRFRFVTENERPVPGALRVTGVAPPAVSGLTWDPEALRYDGSILLKQGRYTYGYSLPTSGSAQGRGSLSQPTVYTALVFYRDLSTFADRLVGVESRVVR